MTNAIQVNHLSFSYGKQDVLKNLSFRINAGSMVGLIGKNGAGKTTLLKLLQGIFLTQGEILIFDRQPKKARCWFGTMPQDDLKLPGVTVIELLRNIGGTYVDPVDPMQLLQLNGIQALANTRLNRLSGGQLRRVTFLCALVGRPKLLFLDEPTVGMDVNARQMLWQQVKKLQQVGVTVVITSHYLDELQDVADELLILQAGRISFQGTFDELRHRDMQTTFRFHSSRSQAQLKQLPAVQSVSQHGDYWVVVSTNADATLAQMSQAIDQFYDLTINKQSLTNIFSDMTKMEGK